MKNRLNGIFHTRIEWAPRRRVRARGLQRLPASPCRPGPLTRRSACEVRGLIGSIILVSLTASASAAPIEFDFKDPKGVNNVIFKTDAPLESINGTATGISGKVTFDPDNPAAIRGTIIVQASSLHLGNPMQQEHLHSDKWLDVAKYPEIRFEVLEVKNAKTQGNVTTAEVAGKMSLHGVTRTVTAPVKITYLKDKLKDRTGKDGDLLVIRSTFTIKRSDFGINPGLMEEKVSNEIELILSIAGAAQR